jgi:hypothetical protein
MYLNLKTAAFCPHSLQDYHNKRRLYDKYYPLEQRFSTGVPGHTGVTRRVRWCATGVWGKNGKKSEKKLRNKKILEIHDQHYFLK